MAKTFTLTLGRHKIKDPRTGEEVKKTIFGTELTMNIRGLEDFCYDFIRNNGIDETYEVFVTGFTPALTSFIKVLYMLSGNKTHLVLFHYDNVADTYRQQNIF